MRIGSKDAENCDQETPNRRKIIGKWMVIPTWVFLSLLLCCYAEGSTVATRLTITALVLIAILLWIDRADAKHDQTKPRT